MSCSFRSVDSVPQIVNVGRLWANIMGIMHGQSGIDNEYTAEITVPFYGEYHDIAFLMAPISIILLFDFNIFVQSG